MKDKTFIFFGGIAISLVIISAFCFTLAEEEAYKTPTYNRLVSCYDNYNNQIIGTTCIEKVPYSNIKLQNLVTLGLIFLLLGIFCMIGTWFFNTSD